jgi:2-polyprenyl-3-methyl-5-hydroxy-6-metoxy-1,4-benzoquinol methylase
MRVSARPTNLMERVALWLGLAPEPLIDTQIAFTNARAIMAGVSLGLFEALEGGALDAPALAVRIGCDETATRQLAGVLVASHYLRYERSTQRFSLGRVARRWLLPAVPDNLCGKLRFQELEWDSVGQIERYVRTGKSLDLHGAMDEHAWNLYQRGMQSVGRTLAAEVAKRTPVPAGATEMLDIGGSAGVLAAALCRAHPALRATILDLPEAVAHAAPLLAEEKMGDRVVHQPGNALTDDLGESRWDLVFMSSLAHHFSDEQNRALAVRVARALKPGGVFVIEEVLRSPEPVTGDLMAAALGLYFGMTSRSGNWSTDEIAGWQKAAGLEPLPPIRFSRVPGFGQQAARRPA